MDDDERTIDEPRRFGLVPASARPEPAPPPEPRLRELVGRVLRDHRRRRGDRLVDVADRAGVSAQYLSEVERGLKDPSSEIVSAVAEAVGLDLDGLLVELARERGLDLGDTPEQVTPPVLVVQPLEPREPATSPRVGPTCLAA